MGFTSDKTLFLELIQVSLYSRIKLSRIPTEKEWLIMMEEAYNQAIIGFLLDGIERIPSQQRPSSVILLKWIAEVQMIECQYSLHKDVIKKTTNLLKESSIPVAFMKGLVCGSRYPNPQRRQCGDIDFVVDEGDFLNTLDKLEQIGIVDRELVHEHHGMAFVDGIQLEPHYKVHNFQSPQVDRRMRELFGELFPDKLTEEYIDGVKIKVFPPTFECVMLVGHMVNHVYAEGLGLRQVIDFYWFLEKKSETINWMDCHRYLRELRMERALLIFSYVCVEYLGLATSYLKFNWTDKDKKFAKKLLNDILVVGNFGRGVDYLGENKIVKPLRSYLWVVVRCCKLGYLCPEEAKWWPISKIYRFVHKKWLGIWY